MKRGDVYSTEKVERSLKNFFRRGNLIALRELALRQLPRLIPQLALRRTQVEIHSGRPRIPSISAGGDHTPPEPAAGRFRVGRRRLVAGARADVLPWRRAGGWPC